MHRIGHTATIFSILIILIHRSYRPQHYPRLTFIPTEAAAAEKLAERPEAEKKAVSMKTGSTSASVSDSVTVQAQVTVTKHDGLTNEVLAGAQIRINGKTYGTGTDGMITHTEEETHKASAEGSTYTYVKDWDSLDAEQRADADSKGYYHSKEEAKKRPEKKRIKRCRMSWMTGKIAGKRNLRQKRRHLPMDTAIIRKIAGR